MNSIKNILLFAFILGVIASAVIAVLLVLDIGTSGELKASLIKVLKVVGVVAFASIVIVFILQIAQKGGNDTGSNQAAQNLSQNKKP